jgi:hypothetical protein
LYSEVANFQKQHERRTHNGKKKWIGSIASVFVIFIALAFGGIGKECGRSVAKKFIEDYESGMIETQSGQAIDKMLQTISENLNNQCPIQADKYTILLSTTVFNRKIIYSYKLDINSLMRDTGFSLSALKDAQKEAVVNNFCTNPDFDAFKQYNVIMEYKYQNIDGTYLFSLSVDKQLCNR